MNLETSASTTESTDHTEGEGLGDAVDILSRVTRAPLGVHCRSFSSGVGAAVSRLRRLSQCGLLAAATAWIAQAQAWAAEPARPVVGTRFVITAKAFTETLASRQAALEAEVAQRMADLCAAELSYVEWRALTNPPSAEDPPWILKGSMVAEGTSLFPAVVLIFEGLGPVAPPRTHVREPLYGANNPDQPYQEESRLRDDLLEKVRTVFENTQNLARLQTRFLVALPVARTLAALSERQRILLPSRWGDMLPGDGSMLRALYEVAQPDGGRVGVKLRLSPSVPLQDQVACTVTLFDYPPVNQSSWHDSMPESLSNAIPESIRVFMEQYVKDYNYTPTTAGGLVTEPAGPSAIGGGQ